MAGKLNPENLEMEEMILVQQQAENRLFMDTVEGMFQAESPDLDWSDHTITAIEVALTRETLTGTSLLDVECRSTLCRIETQHDDPLA